MKRAADCGSFFMASVRQSVKNLYTSVKKTYTLRNGH